MREDWRTNDNPLRYIRFLRHLDEMRRRNTSCYNREANVPGGRLFVEELTLLLICMIFALIMPDLIQIWVLFSRIRCENQRALTDDVEFF